MALNYQCRELQAVRQPPDGEFVQVDDLVQLAGTAWRRKWLILLATGLATSLGAAYCALSRPLYESTAQVLVMKTLPHDSSTAGPRYYYFDEDMEAHLSVIKSPWFIKGAVDSGRLYALPSLAGAIDPVHAVASRISVAPEIANSKKSATPGSTNIFNLSFRGPVQADCPRIVNAVIRQYASFLDENNRTVNEDALRLLTQKTDETRADLRKAQAAHQEFRKTTPLLWNHDEGSGWYQERLVDMEAKRSEATVRRAGIEARLDGLRCAIEAGADRAVLATIIPDQFRHDSADVQERALLPLLQQQNRLRNDYGYGAGHPQVVALREQVELTSRFLMPAPAAEGKSAAKASANPPLHLADPVESYRRYLEQELREVKASEKVLTEHGQQQWKEAKEMAYCEFLDAQHINAIEQATHYYESLLAQLRSIDLNKDLVGYRMRVIAPPETAVQVAPRWLLVLALTTALGLVAGFGLGWAADTRNARRRTPESLPPWLGLSVVGRIPHLGLRKASAPPATTAPAPSLCVYHCPDSAEAEAYRAVAAALAVSLRTEKLKVIQITSPNAQDGKTTLAANLAIAAAQSGKRVLLVDADLRRPHVHQLFGCPNAAGLSSALCGEAEPLDAVQASGIPELWLLPCGPLPPGPADLLAASSLQDLLDGVSHRYDVVLVDTPALLAVPDARVVASQVDGVLLVIRGDNHGHPQIQHALDVFQHVEANLLGIVVNAADQRPDARTLNWTTRFRKLDA